jgi:hypothetical protein
MAQNGGLEVPEESYRDCVGNPCARKSSGVTGRGIVLYPARMNRSWILLCSAALAICPPASAQEGYRWEAGAQAIRLDLDSIGESPGGAGGRISYLLHPRFAVEFEASRYFEDPSGNFGHTQILAGVRYGYWFGPFGIFAKARPGLLRLGGGAAARNPGRENHASLDVGGVILAGRGRFGMRIDAGDTIVWWGSQPFSVGIPLELKRNNRQLSVGFVLRF